MNPSWRRVIVALAVAWPAAACEPILGPSRVDSNWRVVDTPHFSLNVRPGSFAEQNAATLGEVLEDQYAYTARVLEFSYAGRVSMFLYNSAADADMGSDHSGSAYPDTEAVRATCVPPLDGSLFGLLSHESNHVIQQNGLGRPATYFVLEGLPSAVLSERYHSRGKTFLYSWTASHDAQIPPLSNLIDDDKWSSHDQQIAYNASASFLAYLLEVNGPSRLKQLLPVNSKDFARKFEEVYSSSLEEAERAWRAFCAGHR